MEKLMEFNTDELTVDEMIQIEGGNIWGRAILFAYEAAEALTEFTDGFVAGWNAAAKK